MPLSTILVATYRGAFLRETLESLQGQTHTDLEVLVLDDAAEERCRELVDGLGDTRFRYLANAQPLGPAKNHAKGIHEARGEYTTIVNHDDLLLPRAVELLQRPLEADRDLVAVFSRAHVGDAAGIPSPELTAIAHRKWGSDAIPLGRLDNWFTDGGSRIPMSVGPGAMIRSSVAKGVDFPRFLYGAYDAWLGAEVAKTGPVFHLEDMVGVWRQHADNLTDRRSLRRSYEHFALYARWARDGGLPPARRREAARTAARSAVSVLATAVRR